MRVLNHAAALMLQEIHDTYHRRFAVYRCERHSLFSSASWRNRAAFVLVDKIIDDPANLWHVPWTETARRDRASLTDGTRDTESRFRVREFIYLSPRTSRGCSFQ